MKNCEPAEFGLPERAIEITPRASGYGRSRIDDAEFRIWDKAMGDRSK